MSSLRLVILVVLAFAPWLEGAPDPSLAVSIAPDRIRFAWSKTEGDVLLRELPSHTASGPEQEGSALWQGSGTTAEVARLDGTRDRLYSRFQLIDPKTNRPLGEPQFVTDFSALPVRRHSLERPAGKKGIACVVDDDDMAALGSGWAAQNIDIGQLVDWVSPEPKKGFAFDGRRVGLHAGAVDSLDRAIKAKTDRGVAVIGVLLNFVSPQHTPRHSPLVHPRTDPATVPMGPAAFNTATEEGMFLYRAITHWIVDRYTNPDAPQGRLAGLVIGNELQSHWSWYHLGEAEENFVMDEYFAALRVADLCARSVHEDFRVYISLEHHWTLRGHTEDALHEIPGIILMQGIRDRAQRHGDFPWNLAFHPYPENLFDPRFWNDSTAPLRLDAPRITFQNLEVLAAFLRQKEYLWQGRSRHIALTEQGFHCPKGAGGEEVQAAAFALAWKRVQAIPEIETFIYHRHVDHPQEGGLKLGLREHAGSASAMGRKRMIWEVFQKAGTPEEDAAFAFALPIVGRKDWKNIAATELDTRPAPIAPPDRNVVFDFVAQRADGKRENTMALEFKRVMKDAGWLANALQQHPNPAGTSKVTWRVPLPAANRGRLALTFTALLNNPESTGAAFAVRINGESQWRHELKGGAAENGDLDLSSLAGQEVSVSFEVDAMGDESNDWATWVQPRIIIR